MIRLFAIVAAAFSLGCVTAQVTNWKPLERRGAVRATLCNACFSPYDYVTVLEEGQGAGPQEYYYSSRSDSAAQVDAYGGEASGSPRTSAGTTRERFYFWSFVCR